MSLCGLLLWHRCPDRSKSLNRAENPLETFLAKRPSQSALSTQLFARFLQSYGEIDTALYPELTAVRGDRVTILQFLAWDRGDLHRGGRDSDGLEI